MSASVTAAYAFIAAWWASNRAWLIPVLTPMIVPALGWLFTRLTIVETSEKWDAWRKQHPYWTAFVKFARRWGPNAAEKELAKRGIILVDTNKPPPDPRIGTEVKGA